MPPCRPAAPVSLRSNFAWTFAGNAFYAAGQWAILSLAAKLGGREMLGQYALAVAVTTPVVMLSHLNLRAVLATDMDQRHPFGDYLAVRLATTALGLGAIAAIAWAAGYRGPLAAVILATGAAQSVENVSDIYYGAMQRRERMDRIARSMMARGAVSLAAFGAALWATGNLVAAVAALGLGRTAVLAVYDQPRGSAGERLSRSGWPTGWTIARTALPLGVVLMLVSLNTNLPRYAIERTLGTLELGAFAAAASFVTVGSTMVNAIGQAATPRLARYASEHDPKRFLRLSFQLAGLALALGAAGVLAAALLGKLVLSLVYRPEYATYSGVLVAALAAAGLGYVAATFGYAITAARAFNAQAPLFCAVAASCGLAAWILVPRFGLYGAVMALAAASCVQIAGEAWILARALAAMEPAA
ncbi:MAG: lipopolysaccharide biosynthesis protein [Acidobacteria bacterium]|nr:lipopolysaccharide biosynthesis protein [Acidobacteriota bacterium]